MATPSDIAAQALDAIGVTHDLGSIEDGSRLSKVLLRAYGQCLRQLLRAAHWDFARKEAPLLCLADATGATPGAEILVPGRFRFSYAYPDDAVKARVVPWIGSGQPLAAAGNITAPATPPTTGFTPAFCYGRRVPSARFVVQLDTSNQPQPGQQLGLVQGMSTQGRTVVLTDVPCASLIYTALVLFPDNWDALFRAAFVAYLASEVALATIEDKKLALAVRREQIAIAHQKVTAARVADGNEGTTSTDHEPDFIRGRYGPGLGFRAETWFGEGYDRCAFADGTFC